MHKCGIYQPAKSIAAAASGSS